MAKTHSFAVTGPTTDGAALEAAPSRKAGSLWYNGIMTDTTERTAIRLRIENGGLPHG